MNYKIQLTIKFIEDGITEKTLEDYTSTLHIGEDRLVIKMIHHRLEMFFEALSNLIVQVDNRP